MFLHLLSIVKTATAVQWHNLKNTKKQKLTLNNNKNEQKHEI